jgi:hypothetical protein
LPTLKANLGLNCAKRAATKDAGKDI